MTYLRFVRFIPSICFILAISLFCGCDSTYYKYQTDSLSNTLGTVTYQETCKVNTEPPGCRIYCQEDYQGTSPLEIGLNGGDVEILKSGTYRTTFTYDYWTDQVISSTRSPTRWGGLEFKPKRGGSWTVKAFKEGYEPTTYVINMGDEIFRNKMTATVVDESDIPDEIVANRNILIVLSPVGARANYDNQRSTDTGARRSRRSEESAAAKREYEEALAAYNQALKELNNARTLAAAPKKYPHPALGALMAIAEPHSVAEAERKVEIARQRLERARARMNHSEW